MSIDKIIILLKQNWDVLLRFQKTQLLEVLHQHYSLRQLAELIGKDHKSLHWYLRYQPRASTKFFDSSQFTAQPIESLLNDFIEQLPVYSSSDVSDPFVELQNGVNHLPPNGDDEKTPERRRGEHNVRFG